MSGLHLFSSHRIGLALSGGSVRGLAHIGVIKALVDHGIKPSAVAGTSVGSIVGAALAAGMTWQEIEALARNIFWPRLLHGKTLERFCTEYLPKTFADLEIPFLAMATELPDRSTVAIGEGNLATAISASCAMPGIRRPVKRAGKQLKDGGIACVLPSVACRSLGAEFIVAVDVWEVSFLLHWIGIGPDHRWASHAYPPHYHAALRNTDLLIRPRIPWSGYLSGPQAVERMIVAGENATKIAMAKLGSELFSVRSTTHPQTLGGTPDARRRSHRSRY
jgi:NTE family protein